MCVLRRMHSPQMTKILAVGSRLVEMDIDTACVLLVDW